MNIEKRSYGICMTYSREIPKARLEVKPSALLCLNCQSEHESSSPSPAEFPSPDSSRSGDFFT
ncbi:MAG: TraR/DksA family transcriptional regulator [Akkermansiaceae bacterium]